MTRPLLASALMLAAAASYPPPEPAWTAEPPTPRIVALAAPEPACTFTAPCLAPSDWRP